MEQRNELKDLLYEKMSKEQDNFIEKLKHSSPEEIEEYRKHTKRLCEMIFLCFLKMIFLTQNKRKPC